MNPNYSFPVKRPLPKHPAPFGFILPGLLPLFCFLPTVACSAAVKPIPNLSTKTNSQVDPYQHSLGAGGVRSDVSRWQSDADEGRSLEY